jgi:hypothetical protein
MTHKTTAQGNGDPRPQVIYVERRGQSRDHSLLMFLVFGWWYLAVRLARWTFHLVTWPVRLAAGTVRFGATAGWKTTIEWPVRACVAGGSAVVRLVRSRLAH